MCNEGHNKILPSKLDDRPLSAGILMFGLCVLFFHSGCRDAKIIYANLICHSMEGGGLKPSLVGGLHEQKQLCLSLKSRGQTVVPQLSHSCRRAGTIREMQPDAEDLFSLWICLHRKKSVWSTLPIILCRFQ